jgi:DNA-binding transcriptional LysR family regulator
MSYNIEIRHLRYFSALAEELHFRKAAEKLYITQPGLSRQIKILEEQLGVQLLKRNKKSVSLTRAGNYLKTETDYILNHILHVSAQVKAIGDGHKGEIRIGFVGSAMQKVIPELLLKLDDEYPGVSASLEELSNQSQINQLMNDKLDIGFVRLRRTPNEIQSIAVNRETFSLVLPQNHHLDKNNFNNLGQLKDEHFILFSRIYSPDYFSTVMSLFDDQSFVPTISHKSVHANTIYKLVENNLGIAIVPTSLSKGFDLKIKFIELDKIPQRTTLYLCYKKNNRNPAMKNFLSLVKGIKE